MLIECICTRILDLSLHSRPPDQPKEVPLDDDDATVVTGNTAASSQLTIEPEVPHALTANVQTKPGIDTNHCHALMTDDDEEEEPTLDASSVAVDSGASDNFDDKSAPGTSRQTVSTGVAMASATGHWKTSVARDTFDLPSPQPALNFHVFKGGEIQRPLLSVGKACNAGCMVLFAVRNCCFVKDRALLLQGHRDPLTGLCSPPHKSCTPDEMQLAFNLSTPCRQRACDTHAIPNLMRFQHTCVSFPVTLARGFRQCARAVTWGGLAHLPQG